MRRAISLLPLFLLLTQTPVATGQDLSNAPWLDEGAYAKYSSNYAPLGRIFLSNDTKLKYTVLSSPTVFQWGILKVVKNEAHVNVSLCVNGEARVVSPDGSVTTRQCRYSRSFVADVDLRTMEASVNHKSLGMLGFWAEVNTSIGHKISLFSSPSDFIIGNVTGFRSLSLIGKRIDSYDVHVFNLEPFALADYSYDRRTGVALTYTLLGSVEILPNSTSTYQFPNGTLYRIVSYAGTKLSELLGLEHKYVLTLSETNLDLGEDEHTTHLQLYVIGFAGLFASLSTVFVLVDRMKRRKSSRRGSRH